MKSKKLKYRVVVENGQPREVILDIEDFEHLLEKLEDKYDLETLQKMRQKQLKFRRLEDVLKEGAGRQTRSIQVIPEVSKFAITCYRTICYASRHMMCLSEVVM